MKKMKYKGDLEVILPIHGLAIKPGDEVEVEDEFNNDLFVPVEEEAKNEKKKGDK